jgi:hypothetical protein
MVLEMQINLLVIIDYFGFISTFKNFVLSFNGISILKILFRFR